MTDPVRVEAAKKWAEFCLSETVAGVPELRVHLRVLLDALEAAEREPSRRSWQAMELNLREALRERDKAVRDLAAALDALREARKIADSIDLWDDDGVPFDPGLDGEAGKVLALRALLAGSEPGEATS